MTEAQPQFSPDGRFYWNGVHWVPVAPKQRSSVGCVTRPTCLILTIGGVLLILIAGFSVAIGNH